MKDPRTAPPTLWPGDLPKRRPTPSEDELAAILRWLARVLLEVERGYRPAGVLRRFLAPHLLFEVENATRPAGTPPVAQGDIGGARFQRIGRRRGFGVVVIKEADGKWSALMFVLQRDDAGAWRVVEITRPRADEAGIIVRPSPAREGGERARR